MKFVGLSFAIFLLFIGCSEPKQSYQHMSYFDREEWKKASQEFEAGRLAGENGVVVKSIDVHSAWGRGYRRGAGLDKDDERP